MDDVLKVYQSVSVRVPLSVDEIMQNVLLITNDSIIDGLGDCRVEYFRPLSFKLYQSKQGACEARKRKLKSFLNEKKAL